MQALADVRQLVVDTKVTSDVNRKKHGRGRANSVSGRGRGSRVQDQTRLLISPSTVSSPNGELENSYKRVCIMNIGLCCYNFHSGPYIVVVTISAASYYL